MPTNHLFQNSQCLMTGFILQLTQSIFDDWLLFHSVTLVQGQRVITLFVFMYARIMYVG